MHARIQTWAPFRIQLCRNGREWLARRMDQAGLGCVRRRNCFTWLEDPAKAQRLMDRQVQPAWPDQPDTIAHKLNPAHAEMFRDVPEPYYWSAHQTEWATGILFRDARTLAGLYPKLVQHGLATFLSPDVMRFLGRNIPPQGTLPPRLAAAVTSDMKRRPEGVRIKHRPGENSIRMYDQRGRVLRVETTINDPAGFKVWRTPAGTACGRGSLIGIAAPGSPRPRTSGIWTRWPRWKTPPGWANWWRSCASRPAGTPGARGRSTHWGRATNLFEAISRGAFAINGFPNRDLRQRLFNDANAPKPERRRNATRVSRLLSRLWTHRLIARVDRTHRYHLTRRGRTVVAVLINVRNVLAEHLTKLAA